MTEQTYSVRHERSVYDGFMKLDLYAASLTQGERTVDVVREVHDHGNGAAVLPYDETRKTCLLVRQVRLPVHVAEGNGLILEAAAGLIDPEDKDPAEAAVREAGEELGYRVHDPVLVSSFYPIPGMVTEQMNCFIARYTAEDKLPDGGPAADEDEMIDVEEWALADLWRAFEAGDLRDGKAIVCLMGLRIARPDLFV